MKMVKSLLLGSAAGLVAVAGAQAADLPVKAKAVEYVKVCSLYGAGFYYIPGTDTCIKLGGYVRAEWNHNAGGSFTPYVTASATNAGGYYTRYSDTLVSRARGIITVDTRSQTEYGTLRSYIRAGWTWTTNNSSRNFGTDSGTGYFDRAFIQLAGFTFGKTQSFFDTGMEVGLVSLLTRTFNGDTGGSGQTVFAYTASLGNGVTATLSLEDNSFRSMDVVDLAPGAFGVGGAVTGADTHGNIVPDIVANLRVDQAWGSAQIAGALHNVRGGYYGAGVTSTHPGDEWGWAVTAGLKLNMPWNPKDIFFVSGAYADGATGYLMDNAPTAGFGGVLRDGGTLAFGWANDGYFIGPAGSIDLPTAWNAAIGFEHYWTPTLRQSIYANYFEYEMPGNVNTAGCVNNLGTAPGCFDWSAWQVGSRLLWNPVSNLDVGLEVVYTEIDGANCGNGTCGTVVVPAAAGAGNALATGSAGAWSGILRVQRNFWP